MYDDQPSRVPSSEEVHRALRRCWQPVARVQDLQRGPQRAVLLGEALAVFLTDSGEPAVVSDRCAHRGASLSTGAVAGEAIQCPYHGWQWRVADGACVRIPSLADQGQIPVRARIPAYPVRVQWGLVWTALEVAESGPPGVVYATFAMFDGAAVPSSRARKVIVPELLPVRFGKFTLTRRAAALNEPASSPVTSVSGAPFSRVGL